MISRIIIGLVASIAFAGIAVFAVFMMQPSEVVIENSLVIDADPQQVFGYVDDFHAWQQWSPIAGADSEVSVNGAERGEGAVLEWTGGDEVGSGQMTIVDSRPGESVEIELELNKDARSWHTVIFAFEPVDDGTRVTWSTHTEMSSPMQLYITDDAIEEMIGDDLDRGMTQLAAIVDDGHVDE